MGDTNTNSENAIKYIDVSVENYFGKDGEIKEKLSNFEVRNEQYEMSKYIAKGINENKKVIIEAGTGTGKTVAYLLPTILYAIENDLQLVVSTNTINLQEQLINKDIPLIKKILNKNFTYELVKGKGNYLCKRKMYGISLFEKKNETEEEKWERNTLQNILEWDKNTTFGDKAELKYEIPYNIWEQVNCETDLCTGKKCPYYSSCYFFKARKNIDGAKLLIVNHHMFFADLAIRKEAGFDTDFSILPNYHILVFDEAHNIEDTARSYFTYEISRYNFGKLIGNIYNRRIERNKSTILTKMLVFLNENLDQEKYVKIDELKDEIIKELNIYYDEGLKLFDKIMFPLSDRATNEIKLRIDNDKVKNSKMWKEVLEIKRNFQKCFNDLKIIMNRFLNYINDLQLEDEDGKIYDFIKYYERLKEYDKTIHFILDTNDDGYVYWLSMSTTKANIKLYATPFDVSCELEEHLFNKLNRIVFTSATLAVDNKFNYFKENIGLQKEKLIEKIINSPFDYEKQMKVFIPSDTLDPNDIDFLDDLEKFIVEIIKSTKGKCFLLFTSYSSMNYLYNNIKYSFGNEYTLIKQSDYPRHEMIEIFKKSENPVLFGTDSFWEGVDVQGEQLQSVIIIKIPFKVPNDPITEAIIENLKKNGKNPFNDYQVPQAVIKFKQGVGRLIRSKEDKGIITILDNRIITKNYGKKFLKDLPKNIVKKSKKEILQIIDKNSEAKNGN